MSNADRVRAMYAGFQRGDVAPIIEAMAPEVRWDEPAQNTDAPWLQPRRGPQGVADFLASLAAIEFHRFDVRAVLEGVRVDEPDEIHIWTFNEAGQVTGFRHKVDTRQHQLAFAGA